MSGLAAIQIQGYCGSVAAKSATGFGDPNYPRRTSAHPVAGAFLCPLYRVMVAVRGRPLCLPVPLDAGSPTCAQSPPSFWREIEVAPQSKELHP